MTWEPIDCIERHKEHPDTFEIPTESDIAAVKVGDFCKLIWEATNPSDSDDFGGERMWVRVTRIGEMRWQGEEPIKLFVGELDNEPVVVTNLLLGELVTFEPKNIAAITVYEEVRVV